MGIVDPHFNETVRGVASGVIQEINFESAAGKGPMTKSVPVPSKPDDTEYIAGLTIDEKEIFKLYQEITENKEEKKLIELIETQKIKPTQVNKEG